MILIDSNIPMYLVGTANPLKTDAQHLLERYRRLGRIKGLIGPPSDVQLASALSPAWGTGGIYAIQAARDPGIPGCDGNRVAIGDPDSRTWESLLGQVLVVGEGAPVQEETEG